MQNKRIWAMVGVVYMVFITLLTTYAMATDSYLTGLTGLMLFPALAGLSVQAFNERWKLRHPDRWEGDPPRGTETGDLALGILAALAGGYALFQGAGQLLSQLLSR